MRLMENILVSLQRRGKKALERIGMPSKYQESWRLTDINRLKKIFVLPINKGLARPDCPPVPEGVLRLFLDGVNDPLEGVSFPEGLTVLSPEEIQQSLGQMLNRSDCDNSWPVEFNHANSQRILALRVCGQVPPLELVLMANSGLTATRVLLLIEEKAELDLLQIVLASGVSAHSHVIEIHLGKYAKLNHGFLACSDGEPSLLSHLVVEQDPCSSYLLSSVVQGWSLARFEPRVVQIDGQASTVLKGLAVTDGNQQLATHSFVRFDGPSGQFDQLQKCLAEGHSHTIFKGSIFVPKEAQQTNASQLSRNFLLSDKARVDTKPELQIVADDVRCAHGATVTQLHEDQLFYLQSRGIPASGATCLILRGACKEVIDYLPVNAEVWIPLERVIKRLVP